jgi:hypothetical protein
MSVGITLADSAVEIDNEITVNAREDGIVITALRFRHQGPVIEIDGRIHLPKHSGNC